MRETENVGPWVVYRVPAHGRQGGMSALCTQWEWEAMERATPGHYALVRAGITNEGEAERLARATPAEPPSYPPPCGLPPRPSPNSRGVEDSPPLAVTNREQHLAGIHEA